MKTLFKTSVALIFLVAANSSFAMIQSTSFDADKDEDALSFTSGFSSFSESDIRAINKENKQIRKRNKNIIKLNKVCARKIFSDEQLNKWADYHRVDRKSMKEASVASVYYDYVKDQHILKPGSLKIKSQMLMAKFRGSLPDLFA